MVYCNEIDSTTHFGDRIIPTTIIEVIMTGEQNWRIIHGWVKNVTQAKKIEERQLPQINGV